jgi:hypothetical protein
MPRRELNFLNLFLDIKQIMSRLDLYKELYFKEVEKKDALNDSLNLPFGLISALLAVWFYYSVNYDYKFNSCIFYIFIICLFISLILLIVAVFFLLKSYINLFRDYRYSILPAVDEIDRYYVQLVEWYKENKGTVQDADNEFEEYLVDIYRDASSNDSHENIRRSENFIFGKVFLYCSIVGLLITSLCFGYNYYKRDKKDTVYKVEVVNPK